MNLLAEILSLLGLATAIPVSVNAFPASPYPDPFALTAGGNPTASLKLKTSLLNAISNAQILKSVPFPLTIAEFTTDAAGKPTEPFPVADYQPDPNPNDYIASETKVAVMYAAYELRAMVRQFAKKNSTLAPADLLAALASTEDITFIDSVPLLNSANVALSVLRPQYRTVFSTTLNSAGLMDFNTSFLQLDTSTGSGSGAMWDMMSISSDPGAKICVQGIGYSFLNGTLNAGGFFDGTSGVWVATDYLHPHHQLPQVKAVVSANDGKSASAGTTRQMARLLALIRERKLVEAESSQEMDFLLAAASGGIAPFLSRDQDSLGRSIDRSKFTYNKLGYGPLGRNGPFVKSECSLIDGPVASGRKYVVAWQNLADRLDPNNKPFVSSAQLQYTVSDLLKVVLDTIDGYEK